MKKLNITKERFEKSRYFTKKYGKLEYVSESGKLFKTSKGKVLKFNESADFDDEGHLDADEDNPKFSIGDKVIWNDSLWKVVDCWYDSIEGSNLYDLKGLDTREETSDVPGDELCAHDGGIAYESTRKSKRKFNESFGLKSKFKVGDEVWYSDWDDASQTGSWVVVDIDYRKGNAIYTIENERGETRRALEKDLKTNYSKFNESTDLDEDLLQVIMNIKKDLLKSKWLNRVTSPGPGVNEEIDLETNEGKHYYLIVKPSVLNGY